MKFSELGLNDEVLMAVEAMNFKECTPIQEQSLPPVLQGRDFIGVAQTGTGKTAAYLLPVLQRLSESEVRDQVKCLIMAPTRELAQQIDREVQGFSYFMNVSSVAVYGGNDGIRFANEQRGLTEGAEIIIATPGRLLSHISLGYVDFSTVSFFILDEADRMLDMGFYDDIMEIASHLPEQHQTLMFSATMPDEIYKLSNKLLHDPASVALKVSKPADNIIQTAYVCYEPQKLGILQTLFNIDEEVGKVIIFASSKLKVKEVAKALKRMNFKVGDMHSDLTQEERDKIMYKFKAGEINILVATDIVARGIDIDDIRLVINYDVPHDSEDYVHRIGRTARAGSDGCAITFINPDDQRAFGGIERFLEKEIYKIPLPDGMEGPEYNPGSRKSRGGGRRRNSSGHGKNGSRTNSRNRGRRTANRGKKNKRNKRR